MTTRTETERKAFERAYSCYILYKEGATIGEQKAAFEAVRRICLKYDIAIQELEEEYSRNNNNSSSGYQSYQNERNKYDSNYSNRNSNYGNNNQKYQEWKDRQYKKQYHVRYATEAQKRYVNTICNFFELRRPGNKLTFEQASEFLRTWAPTFERFIKFKDDYTYPKGW